MRLCITRHPRTFILSPITGVTVVVTGTDTSMAAGMVVGTTEDIIERAARKFLRHNEYRKVETVEEQNMKARHLILAATGFLLCFNTPVFAHDIKNMQHSHAFQKTGYGKVREGHYVNGPQGSIIVWAPGNAAGYGKSPVTFARPTPITSAPGTPVANTKKKPRPTIEYGKP